MHVKVMLSTTLRDLVQGYNPHVGIDMEPENGTTAGLLAEAIGIPPAEIKIVMINGRSSSLAAVLNDNDRVAFFPAVGGG
ncbi:MAG: MoaD/ThiS family protein [Desulfovibrio sp.]|nr:MoaD/ThiS family protein [Desulfovibrio sp.]